MEMYKILILSCFISVVSSTVQSCVDIHTDTIRDSLFEGHTYQTMSTCGYQQCLRMCGTRRECQSINYHASHLYCELNTETITNPNELTSQEGFIFKDTNGTSQQVGSCEKSTCLEYHTCVTLISGNYVCMVPVSAITTTTTTTEVPITTTTTTTTITAAQTTTTETPTTTAGSPTCVSPYTHNVGTGLCLYFDTTSKTWAAAKTDCPNGGSFFIADSDAKLTASLAMCTSSCWIAAEKVGGVFIWTNNAVVSPTPDPGTGDCLSIRNGVVKGGTCSFSIGYMCEQV